MAEAGPLSDITVVDLSRVLAGPYCSMLLADLGARVIKVERPGVGDDARSIGPFLESGDGTTRKSAYFMSLNRGKQSIALDLRDEADRKIFESLIERCDVLVENFRPGAMDRLGYDWETLHARYPSLIYAATSGFGRTGPYAARPAYDMVVQGMGGIMSLTGHTGSPPTRVGTSVGDITAALFTAVGINAALYHRARSGRGQLVDVAMLDCQVAILENAIARDQATGEVPGPLGARHPSITPFDAFATADDHIIIAAGNDEYFRKLCQTLERPALCERPEFASNEKRTENHAALRAELEAALRRKPGAEWLRRLEAAEIPCGPIQDVAQVLADPQVIARNMVVTVQDNEVGALQMAGNPIKFSDFADPAARGPVPDLDGNRETILDELRKRKRECPPDA
ncbi:MAG: CoA transferase [Myxococcota bacterium]